MLCDDMTKKNIFRVEFTIGSKAVNNFRMIERHFFRDKLLKSFDFEFGFCIPNSKNTCEHIYEFPTLSSELGKNKINFLLNQVFINVKNRHRVKLLNAFQSEKWSSTRLKLGQTVFTLWMTGWSCTTRRTTRMMAASESEIWMCHSLTWSPRLWSFTFVTCTRPGNDTKSELLMMIRGSNQKQYKNWILQLLCHSFTILNSKI